VVAPLIVLDPYVPPPAAAGAEPAAAPNRSRGLLMRGTRVSLLNNTKPNVGNLFAGITDVLVPLGCVVQVVEKEASNKAMSDGVLVDVLAISDFVITAMGD
jgi:hypothetical protein